MHRHVRIRIPMHPCVGVHYSTYIHILSFGWTVWLRTSNRNNVVLPFIPYVRFAWSVRQPSGFHHTEARIHTLDMDISDYGLGGT